MNQEILMSIRPQHLVNILNGKKTIELRKKFPSDYRGWVYCYCTKGEPYLHERNTENTTPNKTYVLWDSKDKASRNIKLLTGKVVCRFWVENVEEIICRRFWGQWESYTKTLGYSEISQASCLGNREIVHYLKGNNGSAIHISKLEIFDEPKELGEFYYYTIRLIDCGRDCPPYVKTQVHKAPQSWQYIYIEEEK